MPDSRQISTASEEVTSISYDVSLTSRVLRQLCELMAPNLSGNGISINEAGLETARTSAAMCERIFQKVEKEAKKASEQIGGAKRLNGSCIKLSRMEKPKWQFLQPGIAILSRSQGITPAAARSWTSAEIPFKAFSKS